VAHLQQCNRGQDGQWKIQGVAETWLRPEEHVRQAPTSEKPQTEPQERDGAAESQEPSCQPEHQQTHGVDTRQQRQGAMEETIPTALALEFLLYLGL
jgi:hypothetical protein